MKKTLLTLTALIGLTWNVNGQEMPPDESLAPGAVFVNFGEGQEPLAATPWLVDELIEMPEMVINLMLLASGGDEVSFTYVPHFDVLAPPPVDMVRPNHEEQVEVIISRDWEKEHGLDIRLVHKNIGKLPFSVEIEFFLAVAFGEIAPVAGAWLDGRGVHFTKNSTFDWNDPTRENNPDLEPFGPINREIWTDVAQLALLNEMVVLDVEQQIGMDKFRVYLSAFINALKWQVDPQ